MLIKSGRFCVLRIEVLIKKTECFSGRCEFTTQQMALELGFSESYARQALNLMAREGRATKLDDDKYIWKVTGRELICSKWRNELEGGGFNPHAR